jgi:hypothetical protein
MKCCAPSSAGEWLDLGRRKTPDRLVLRVERLEHGQQFRDRQQIGDAFGQVEQLEAAALPADGGIRPNDFAEPGAVDVRDVRQIQNDLLVALVDEAVDLVLEEFVALPQGNLPFQVEHYHVADSPFLDLHGNSR